MQARNLIAAIEAAAPPAYQESYDNSGLQVGDAAQEITGVLLTLDITEEVLEEAVVKGCNMIVAHHPLIFSGLKKLAGQNYVARIVQQAIKKDLVLYAAHTNLDNMRNGVNAILAGRLGLTGTSVLQMKTDTLRKLYTFAPQSAADKVRDALFAAGAGVIDKYAECSFNTPGTGTFKPGGEAKPAIGQAGGAREWVDEVKIEVLVHRHQEEKVLRALFGAHPYEEVAYEFIHLHNANQQIGSGMVGELETPVAAKDFLLQVKEKLQAGCIRHTKLCRGEIRRVALCGGSGSFLLKEAIGAGADIFITADYKYHQFFDAEDRIIIADPGHYETEQFVPELLQQILHKKFPTFAAHLSSTNTNPVHYFS